MKLPHKNVVFFTGFPQSFNKVVMESYGSREGLQRGRQTTICLLGVLIS